MDWSRDIKRIPDWFCDHNWENSGEPYRSWASNNTGDECPEGVPISQDQKCTKCHGVNTIYIDKT